VDETDFCLAMGYSKSFWDYKFKRNGYCFEVGLCIKLGDICWWHGPYEPGDWKGQMIFEDALEKYLELTEQWIIFLGESLSLGQRKLLLVQQLMWLSGSTDALSS
jgi:hypothetical protein